MKHYTADSKAAIIKRLMPPNPVSVATLSSETGIPSTTLYNWRKQTQASGQAVPATAKHYRDLKNAVDTAREEGLEEGIQKGREEGMRQSILALHSNGFDTASIAKNLGISLAMVESVLSAVGKWE